jgi:hypothetical protein
MHVRVKTYLVDRISFYPNTNQSSSYTDAFGMVMFAMQDEDRSPIQLTGMKSLTVTSNETGEWLGLRED